MEQASGKKREPNAGTWRPGQSGNPRGRPRRADALAIAIRDQVPPEDLIATARAIKDDESAPASVRLQAAQFLAERGYARPAERHEVVMGTSEADEDMTMLTLEELAIVEMHERERLTVIAAARSRELRALPSGEDGGS
jgi:hypothetical protein